MMHYVRRNCRHGPIGTGYRLFVVACCSARRCSALPSPCSTAARRAPRAPTGRDPVVRPNQCASGTPRGHWPAARRGGRRPSPTSASSSASSKGPPSSPIRPRCPRRSTKRPCWPTWSRAGSLPPVEQRLPEEPHGAHSRCARSATYGGTWRRAFTGPADGENMNRIMAVDKLLFVDYTGLKIVPSVARAWKVSDDGRTITLTLRKGLKWSDGQPFTADDIMFWFQDLYSNKELTPTPSTGNVDQRQAWHAREGRRLHGRRQVPGSRTRCSSTCSLASRRSAAVWRWVVAAAGAAAATSRAPYAPAHYLKQFHPKYVAADQFDQAGQGRAARQLGRA